MRDAYDADHNIRGPEAVNHAFASIMMHPFVKAQNDGIYVSQMRKYRSAKILKHYGLNWVDYMSLPYDIAQMLLRDAQVANEEDAKRLAALGNLPGLDDEL